MPAPKPTFGHRVVAFNKRLHTDFRLPAGVKVMNPFGDTAVMDACRSFYNRYYADQHERVFIFGINPGRRGAGVTGIPFTDPVHLADACGIANPFPPVAELSSSFVYRFIASYGGPEEFFGKFYITSVFPLGFTRGGKNLNYYDDKALLNACLPGIVRYIDKQLAFGAVRHTCFSMGAGQNLAILQKLNAEHDWFGKVESLPHPRWVMQYRRRQLDRFISQYVDTLHSVK